MKAVKKELTKTLEILNGKLFEADKIDEVMSIVNAIEIVLSNIKLMDVTFEDDKPSQTIKQVNKVIEPPQANEEEIRKTKRIHEHFQNLMNYDVEQAVEGKKVE